MARGTGLSGELISMSGTPLTKKTSAPKAKLPAMATSVKRPPDTLGVDARETG